eukprot:CAMPEP_0177247558 /NCGR_PEP_ID=MMETSP0367-20130122/51651_1 /TAXON_ID=447022 ORGANISM="Scrippsiella hangoei-like, Strain SHHI-4" /NCGR_SAMPLE_ID=MMETSP0367 /ASSEMBLY_ACC=CAM_ASM_000362 /LENGTH=87 /DNA_ID=CAMNT_0018699741 /DNA_START=62 /DNA_END=321 /DNA_ORIENTATION=-
MDCLVAAPADLHRSGHGYLPNCSLKGPQIVEPPRPTLSFHHAAAHMSKTHGSASLLSSFAKVPEAAGGGAAGGRAFFGAGRQSAFLP